MSASNISNTSNSTPRATGYAFRREEGETFAFLGTQMTLKASGAGSGFGLIEQVAPPGFAAPPHIHHAEDEAFYVLEGEATFTCGDQDWAATAGSFVFLPRGVAHHFAVGGERPARLLQLNLPAGLERFFVEAGAPIDAAEAGPPDFARLAALATAYRVELLGPPPGH
ncbi:MAG TPA: cupin domain-containing protein [Dehalococcoidia bacterium]|nr:cupin domain-containing protein [Dehalococcoidia bacterium]